MPGLKLDMKVDTQRNLAPIVDFGVVVLVAVLIVVAAGSLTLPIVGVVALWAAYYLVGLEWAGEQTLGKRVAARSEAMAAAPAPVAAPAPAAAPAPVPDAPEEEPAGETGPDLVSPALRELIADLETAKADAKTPDPEDADEAEEAPELEPAAEAEELELEEPELEPAPAALAEDEPEAEQPEIEEFEVEGLEAEEPEIEGLELDEPEVEEPEVAEPEPVEAYEDDDEIDEATVEALLEEESPADATRK